MRVKRIELLFFPIGFPKDNLGTAIGGHLTFGLNSLNYYPNSPGI